MDSIRDVVLSDSAPLSKSAAIVQGAKLFNLNFSSDMLQFIDSFSKTGFQATELGKAIEEVKRMIKWRGSSKNMERCDDEDLSDCKCTIFLSFTSNMMSSGLREIFLYLAKNRMIDVIVTSAGGVEEDFIKCLAPTYIGEFSLDGKQLRDKGWNRIGNLIVPNKNYCCFEDWIQPLLDKCLLMQAQNSFSWTPSKLIDFLGKNIDNEESVFYWCYKNKIPVYCPGLTDGALGDNLYFHSYRNPGLKIDVVEDIRQINQIAVQAKCTGMIILGGGIAKHHTCNANLMRNGADFAVYVNTAQEFDGSDSGARPDEAVSWGKIRKDANPVKVFCDATIAFPIIVAGSFFRI